MRRCSCCSKLIKRGDNWKFGKTNQTIYCEQCTYLMKSAYRAGQLNTLNKMLDRVYDKHAPMYIQDEDDEYEDY